jgi:hypothetical protein
MLHTVLCTVKLPELDAARIAFHVVFIPRACEDHVRLFTTPTGIKLSRQLDSGFHNIPF